jgi:hypothetical protein
MKKSPDSKRIDYHHFLHSYNPVIAPHQLDGTMFIKNYSEPTKKPPLAQTAPIITTLGSSKSNQFQFKPSASDDISIGTTSTIKAAKASAQFSNETDDLKRIWHAVLRECHRSDPERNGQVGRTVFIAALQRANLGKVNLFLNIFNLLLFDNYFSCFISQ